MSISRNFSKGDNVAICFTYLGCYRWNANGCSQTTLSFLQHKENAPCYGNSGEKCASLAAI